MHLTGCKEVLQLAIIFPWFRGGPGEWLQAQRFDLKVFLFIKS
jgi:hypothetical protein